MGGNLAKSADPCVTGEVDHVLVVLEIEDRVEAAAIREHEAVGAASDVGEVGLEVGEASVAEQLVIAHAADQNVGTGDRRPVDRKAVASEEVVARATFQPVVPSRAAAADVEVFAINIVRAIPAIQMVLPACAVVVQSSVSEEAVSTGASEQPVVSAASVAEQIEAITRDDPVVAIANVDPVVAAPRVPFEIKGVPDHKISARTAGDQVVAAAGIVGQQGTRITVDAVAVRAAREHIVAAASIAAHLGAGVAVQVVVAGTAADLVVAAASVGRHELRIADQELPPSPPSMRSLPPRPVPLISNASPQTKS